MLWFSFYLFSVEYLLLILCYELGMDTFMMLTWVGGFGGVLFVMLIWSGLGLAIICAYSGFADC